MIPIGESAGTLWWPPSTTLSSFTPTSSGGQHSFALAKNAARTSIPPNAYRGWGNSRTIDACSETLTSSSGLSEHGVAPAGIDDLDLPDVGVIRAERRNNCPPYGDIQG